MTAMIPSDLGAFWKSFERKAILSPLPRRYEQTGLIEQALNSPLIMQTY